MMSKEFIEESTPVFDGDGSPEAADAEHKPNNGAAIASKQESDSFAPAVIAAVPMRQATEPEPTSVNGASDNWDEEKTIIVDTVEDATASAKIINLSTGQEIEIDSDVFIIGRHRSCQLQLSNNSVSRRHAMIRFNDDGAGYVLEDAGSSNGTFLNDIKIDKVILSDGDKLRIGDVKFGFHILNGKGSAESDLSPIALPDFGLSKLVQRSKDYIARLRTKAAPGSSSTDQSETAPALTMDAAGEEDANPSADVTRIVDPKLTNSDEETGSWFNLRSRKFQALVAGIALVTLAIYIFSPSRRVVVLDSATAQAPAAENPDVAADSGQANKAESSSDQNTPAAAEAVDTDAADAGVIQTTTTVAATGTDDGMATSPIAESTADSPALAEAGDSADAAAAASSDLMQGGASGLTAVDSGSSATGMSGGASDSAAEVDLTEAPQVAALNAGGESASSDAGTATTTEASENAGEPAPKPIRRSPAWSRSYIENSLDYYAKGDVEQATRRLGIQSRSARHQQRFRNEAAQLQQDLTNLHGRYQDGWALMNNGQEDAAFTTWRAYLVDEAEHLAGKKSVFAESIRSEVIRVYTRRGELAEQNGDYHSAYTAWQQAASIAPQGTAAVALGNLESQAKERFIEGYRLESVDIRKAMDIWREVILLVPPGNEYHTKANAKLRLYRRYGASS